MDGIAECAARSNPAIQRVAVALTHAFLAGEASPAGLRKRGEQVLGRAWPWLPALALHLHFELGGTGDAPWPPRLHDQVLARILVFPGFLAAFAATGSAPEVKGFFPFHMPMALPPAALADCRLPPIATPGELAEWLELTPGQLDWFADAGAWDAARRPPKAAHYHTRWVAKRAGGARLIEAPKAMLRFLQRRILREILDRVPVHDAAHGCVRGRSVLDAARPHCGSPLLIKLDLRDFFVSIPGGRVQALFRTLGYPADVARYLSGLTTHRVSPAVLRDVPQEEFAGLDEQRRQLHWARQFLAPHLPQGAPTSPALANLCAFRLDLRLAGAARECGARYSRYVDDLVFSCDDGDFAHGQRILSMMQAIVREEGFVPHWKKSRVVPAGAAQRVTGIMVNTRPNVPRKAFDAFKALLTNCCRYGVKSQNRAGVADFRASVAGRLAWFRHVNPERARRLQALYDKIVWD